MAGGEEIFRDELRASAVTLFVGIAIGFGAKMLLDWLLKDDPFKGDGSM